MRILIAPNAFKHSATAHEAARAIALGLEDSGLGARLELCPVGDGGDGTVRLLAAHLGAAWIAATVRGPLGLPVNAGFGWVAHEALALIELADASGLRLLAHGELDPLRADTFGTGELMLRALEHGARHIVLCVGGSATVDGGAGLLAALGVRFLDGSGRSLPSRPRELADLRRLDVSPLDPRMRACRLTVLCDVVNPLLGPRGSAAIFGPQKGARAPQVVRLEAMLENYAQVLEAATGIATGTMPRAGAAGGVAAGLHAALGAELVEGIEFFLDMIRFDSKLHDCDAVITGEGSIDAQTAEGKAPWGVARRAKSSGAITVGLAGRVPMGADPALDAIFDVLLAIGHAPMSLEDALKRTERDLRRLARALGRLWGRSPVGLLSQGPRILSSTTIAPTR